MKRLLKTATIGFITCFLFAALAIAGVGLRDQPADADLIVVPGNTVNIDGTPSKRLIGRLEAAIDLYHAGRGKVILVSGGFGKEGYDEAAVMKDFLLSHGVPLATIVTDNKGRNTFETARFTAQLMQSKNFRSVVLVSQYFHIARFDLAMQKNGVNPVGHVHSRYFEARDIYSLAREVFAYTEYFFK